MTIDLEVGVRFTELSDIRSLSLAIEQAAGVGCAGSGAGFGLRSRKGTREINAAGAIALARPFETEIAAGRSWLSGCVSASTLIGPQLCAWSKHAIWGDIVLPRIVLYYSNVVPRRDIVWTGGNC